MDVSIRDEKETLYNTCYVRERVVPARYLHHGSEQNDVGKRTSRRTSGIIHPTRQLINDASYLLPIRSPRFADVGGRT